jgi:CBS domain-containing protein
VKQTVGEAMHPGVITCPPGTTLRRVAAILAEHRIHAVVVAREEDSVPLAVVTDRDVAFRHSRGELDGVTAGGAAMEPTVTVRADADLRQAAELMAQYGTSHVIVTERGGRHPIGVLSTLDVAAAVAAG